VESMVEQQEKLGPWLPLGGRVLRRVLSKAMDTSSAAKMEGGGKNRARSWRVGAPREPQAIFNFEIFVVRRSP
jgi:hypothetical protein